MPKYLVFITLMLCTLFSFGQSPVNSFQGKFGVFIAVALVVLVGIFAYLIHLDCKIKKLEKQHKEEEEA